MPSSSSTVPDRVPGRSCAPSPARAEPIRPAVAECAGGQRRSSDGPSAEQRRGRRSAAVSTSRRSDGRSSAVDLEPPDRGVPRRRAGPERRPQVVGRPGQQQRRPVALRVADEARGRAPAARRSATASSAGRSAGRSAATRADRGPGWRRAASAAPWASAGVETGVRLVAGRPRHPSADSALGRLAGRRSRPRRRDRAGRRARPRPCRARRPARGRGGASGDGGRAGSWPRSRRLTGTTRHHVRLAIGPRGRSCQPARHRDRRTGDVTRRATGRGVETPGQDGARESRQASASGTGWPSSSSGRC